MDNFDPDFHRSTPTGLRPGIDLSHWLWFGPAIALFLAVLPLPYGYYMLLRWGVAGAGGLIAWREYDLNRRSANTFSWLFGGIALLYNPIIPIELFKFAWVPINIVTALSFIGHHKLRLSKA